MTNEITLTRDELETVISEAIDRQLDNIPPEEKVREFINYVGIVIGEEIVKGLFEVKKA